MFAINFNNYDFKRAGKNFLQVFCMGYIVLAQT